MRFSLKTLLLVMTFVAAFAAICPMVPRKFAQTAVLWAPAFLMGLFGWRRGIDGSAYALAVALVSSVALCLLMPTTSGGWFPGQAWSGMLSPDGMCVILLSTCTGVFGFPFGQWLHQRSRDRELHRELVERYRKARR